MYKSKNKLLSIYLVLCFLITIFTNSFYVFAIDEIENVTSEDSEQLSVISEKLVLSADDVPEVIDFAQAKEKGHVLRMREKEGDDYTVVFLNDDNTETMYVFAEPIKYTDNDGNIKDKSTRLTLSGNKYITEENDINVSFPQNITNGVAVSKGNVSISMTPVFVSVDADDKTLNNTATAEPISVMQDNKMTYSDVFGAGIDIQYTPTYSGFKEDIIIEEHTDKTEFTFVINTNGLYPVLNENGSVSFFDPTTDKVEAEMMQIVCYDANNKFAGGEVRISQIKQNLIYSFTVIPDAEFLSDESTVYPVCVDPTITLNTESAIEDAVIYSGKPDKNYGDYKYSTVGYLDSSYGIGRLMVRFPTLANNAIFITLSGTNITSATYSMYTASGGSTSTSISAQQYPISSWTESTVTWNNIGVGSAITTVSTISAPSGGGQIMSFNIKTAVQNWANGSATPSKGLMFSNGNESNASLARDFLSVEYAMSASDRIGYMPSLQISYSVPYQVVLKDNDNDSNNVIELDAGQTKTFEAYVLQNGYKYYNVLSFVSFDETVAELSSSSSARVTGIDWGSTGIRATYIHNTMYKADIAVNVNSERVIANQSYTLNNDSTTRQVDINAQLRKNGTLYANDVNITYSITDYGVFDEDEIQINSSTGVVTVSTEYDQFSLFIHKTGTIKVLAESANAEITITVNIECQTPLDETSGTPQVPVYEGRYIRIKYPESPDSYNTNGAIYTGNTECFSNAVTAYTEDQTFEKINTNFTKDYYGWFQYDDPSGFGYDRKFFELVRTSRVVFIMTHGQTGKISVNAEQNPNPNQLDDYIITSEDILALHPGYFRRCDLIVLMTCGSADGGSNSIIEAFKARGAKCVIGFEGAVSYNATEAFEAAFWCENNEQEISGKTIQELFNLASAVISETNNVTVVGDTSIVLYED